MRNLIQIQQDYIDTMKTERSNHQKNSCYCSVCGRRTTPNNRIWRASHDRAMNTCRSKACKETGSH